MSKTLVMVPSLSTINPHVYSNHCEFWAKTIRNNPEDQFLLMNPKRMSIDMARNLAAKQAIALDFDYLMFIDDDVMVPANAYKLLKDAQKDVIAGLVIIRGFPFDVMSFKEKIREQKEDAEGKPILNPVSGELMTLYHKELSFYNDLPKKEDGSLVELVECGAVGFSCCLISIEVLKAMRPPYFATIEGCTEDVYFCNRIDLELDPSPTIFTHTGVQCGHLLDAEPIEWQNREKFQKFYEEWALEAAARAELASQVPERNVDYIQRILARM